MATINCPECGTEIQDTAKFCRACGRSLSQSEATTRFFDEPVQTGAPTQDINSVPTAPSYSPPSFPAHYQPHFPAAPSTQGFEKKGGNKTTIIVLAGMVIVLLLALAGIGAWFIFDDRGRPVVVQIPPPPPGPTSPPAIPEVPPIPEIPPIPPIPPIVLPETPPAGTAGAISKDLIYPGAKETMRVGKMIQLRTSDPLNKVSDWYIQKLGSAKKVLIPGGSTILKTDSLTVIVTGGEEGAQIMLTQGNQ